MNYLGPSAANGWRVSNSKADLVRAAVPPRAVSLPAMPKPITIDLARSAMIVVDMQNDFCHPDGWLAGIGVDIAPARAPIAPLAAQLPALRTRARHLGQLGQSPRSQQSQPGSSACL